MSDTREPIDMQAALARIDRNLATSTKLHEGFRTSSPSNGPSCFARLRSSAPRNKSYGAAWRLAPWILGLSLIGALLDT